MSFKRLLITTLFLFCPAPAGSIEPGVPAGGANPGTGAAQAAPRRGSLYRIRHDGRVAYLFGTIHVGTAAFFPLEPEVTGALARATKLVVELDIRQNAAFRLAVAKYGLYPPTDTIANHVSPDTYQRLVYASKAAGLAMADAARYKPWLVGNLLLGMELDQHGFKRSHGTEVFLLAAAHEQAKAVQELESADYQLSLFDMMSDRDQESYLRENLADLRNGTALKNMRALIAAWSKADAAMIEALMVEIADGTSVVSTFMRRTLLARRNPEMAARIATIMRDNDVTFVGVGLLHLAGANGLPRLLAQDGYEVEKLY
jgi:uncharacterized protein